MQPLNSVTYILLFAAVTALLILWGFKKNSTKDGELLQNLCRKGQKKIYALLKKNGQMSVKDLEQYVNGMKASLFYSTRRLKVTDSKAFVKGILEDLIEEGLVEEIIISKHERVYQLK